MPTIKCVVVEARAKALCAGGDIRLLWEQGTAGDHKAQLDFWREEYILNVAHQASIRSPASRSSTASSWAAASACPSTVPTRSLATASSTPCPEVGIGFFPDVWRDSIVLPRSRARPEHYLGADRRAREGRRRVGAAGSHDAHVAREKILALVAALEWREDVDAAPSRRFSLRRAPGPIVGNRAMIDACFPMARASPGYSAASTLMAPAFAQKAKANMVRNRRPAWQSRCARCRSAAH